MVLEPSAENATQILTNIKEQLPSSAFSDAFLDLSVFTPFSLSFQ